MRRVIRMCVAAAALAAVLAPAQARAEGFITPWIGVNFASDPAEGRAVFGGTAGYMGAGVFGAEVDFGYSPSFFGTESDLGSNNLMTVMGNVIVGVPVGGTSGIGVRPFVTGGIGLIRSSLDGLFEDDSISSNDFGFNVGAGVMGFFNDHFGLRGEVRYFRNLNDDTDDDTTGIDLDLFDLGGLDFWRAYIGVVIR